MLIEWDEPFGMVMVEALASGTPVVGYKKGSIPEIITDQTGFIVKNVKEAVFATKQILNNVLNATNCRDRAVKMFSKEAMASGYIGLYIKQEEKFKRENGPHRNG
jgi:glycosyltransferase involved in cell wall biosynthesis